jgi:HK97 family phage portal protein
LFGTTETSLTRRVPSSWGWLRESFAGAWQRGIEVDPIGALTSYGAVYACISRISNDIAKLCPRLMELIDGIWEIADKSSPYWKVLRKPNGFQNRIQFFAYWLVCKLLHGNAYALKARDGRNMVVALFLLDPRRVTPLVTPGGDVYYSLGGDDLSMIPQGLVVPASEIIHDRINCLWHPLVGVSPLVACGISATQGRRIQSNSARFFENMSRPSGMLTAPATIDEVTADRLKREWEANYGGENIGRLAVLGDGLKYEAMTIPAEQAQLIDQLRWTVEDVARAFGMPLYKIGAGPMPTNNNVEALNQQYYDDCLQPHIESLELCLDEGLAIADGSGVEFDLDGLLRMDQTSMINMLVKATTGQVMAPNEARQKINRRPLPGGDTVYMQQQNYSMAALAKRDAKPDPFGTTPPPTPAPTPMPTPEPTPAATPAPQKDLTFTVIAEIFAQAKAMPTIELTKLEEVANA